MHKLMQIIILTYIIGYVMIYMNGYQDTHGLSASVVTKVKGVSNVEDHKNHYRKIWDIPDLIVPPEERNAIFLTTNAVTTINQTQTMCAEDLSVWDARCSNDSDCTKGMEYLLGNGVATGKCIKSNNSKQHSTCEVRAWCPLEDDSVIDTEDILFDNVLNFTLFIRNTIVYDDLEVKRSNLFLWEDKLIPKYCIYNSSHESMKYCPFFKVSTIVGENIGKREKEKLLRYGGVFQVIITWNCNLDKATSKCKPVYSFNRIDYKDSKMSKGWNFRYANYYFKDNREYRTLFKVFGLRILIEVRGKAKKFSIITFTMNLGSGLALLSGATIICDFIILYLMPNRAKYFDTKYQLHDDDDAFHESENEPIYSDLSQK